jgi:hypothetical protein
VFDLTRATAAAVDGEWHNPATHAHMCTSTVTVTPALASARTRFSPSRYNITRKHVVQAALRAVDVTHMAQSVMQTCPGHVSKQQCCGINTSIVKRLAQDAAAIIVEQPNVAVRAITSKRGAVPDSCQLQQCTCQANTLLRLRSCRSSHTKPQPKPQLPTLVDPC